MSVLDAQQTIREHEGRIGALERGADDVSSRLDRIERKIDTVLGMGWKLAVVLLAAVVAPFASGVVR